MKGFEGLGYLGAVLDLGLNINQYQNREIGGKRLAYRVVGIGAGLATPIAIGFAFGAEAGPAGAIGGVVVGGIFQIGERAYDVLTTNHPQTPNGYENVDISNGFHP